MDNTRQHTQDLTCKFQYHAKRRAFIYITNSHIIVLKIHSQNWQGIESPSYAVVLEGIFTAIMRPGGEEVHDGTSVYHRVIVEDLCQLFAGHIQD